MRARNASVSARVPVSTGACLAARARRCALSESCCATSSSYLSRVHAGCVRASSARCVDGGRRGGGACRNRTASPNFHSSRRLTRRSGSVSAVSAGSDASARATTLRNVSCARPAVVGYTGVSRSGNARAGLDDGELRMDDLAAEMTLAHFAEHAHAPSDGQRLLLVRIEMEETQDELCATAAASAPSSRRHTSWRRGRYWMSVRDDAAFRLLLDCLEQAQPAERRACDPRSAAADAGRDPRRARCPGARACRRAPRRASGVARAALSLRATRRTLSLLARFGSTSTPSISTRPPLGSAAT